MREVVLPAMPVAQQALDQERVLCQLAKLGFLRSYRKAADGSFVLEVEDGLMTDLSRLELFAAR